MIAASLKHGLCEYCAHLAAHFRDQMIAASLKPPWLQFYAPKRRISAIR